MTTPVHSVKLKNRVLWFDGDTTMSENQLLDVVMKRGSVDGLFVDEMSESIAQYNKLVPSSEQIRVKDQLSVFDLEFSIPTEFKTIDVQKYVYDKFEEESNVPDDIGKMRIDEELKLYEQLNLIDVLRTLIYVINTLQHNNIVWGVGRGSSVASYVLYLIGVHDVDSIMYELNITDFLRSE